MLTLREWLSKVGFQDQNPFAAKHAGHEGTGLEAYFVEHPVCNRILDDQLPHTTILHARSGEGKSSARYMFEQYYQNRADTLRPLLVELTDWQALVHRAGTISSLRPEHYIEKLLAQALASLVRLEPFKWVSLPQDPDMAGYLNWLCLACTEDLSPAQRRMLTTSGWIVEGNLTALSDYSLLRRSPAQTLTILCDLLQAMGYRACYIVIDRISDLPEVVSNWEIGAQLLEPIIGNLSLLEIPSLAFKYFLPSEVVSVLLERRSLDADRIDRFELEWSGEEGHLLLRKLLQNRLIHFSNGQITSLASRAVRDLHDIDEQLVLAAKGSPRRLLKLGHLLFHTCAGTADDDNLRITHTHLKSAFRALEGEELWSIVEDDGPVGRLPTPNRNHQALHSCFISYSTTDQVFATRLYESLQKAGVTCWFAPHDLEIGEVIVRGIDEAIHMYDKLLIILSEASVKSHWVAFEVSTALHREVEQGRTMLFPIRLDNAVLHTPGGWAAQLRTRHIGDFRGWEDAAWYEKAFARLMQDLMIPHAHQD